MKLPEFLRANDINSAISHVLKKNGYDELKCLLHNNETIAYAFIANAYNIYSNIMLDTATIQELIVQSNDINFSLLLIIIENQYKSNNLDINYIYNNIENNPIRKLKIITRITKTFTNNCKSNELYIKINNIMPMVIEVLQESITNNNINNNNINNNKEVIDNILNLYYNIIYQDIPEVILKYSNKHSNEYNDTDNDTDNDGISNKRNNLNNMNNMSNNI
ncbi:hypothetical protein SLOPH_728 [Spraguea lophii 42_110]|uniref:Uncharacterized protein n=1 Tax=Spraguea lophii (strain 42_110) TaxID=1358809 RepID=S7WCR4_SPRLO|nr:hypothetical protein SLOPH_728 [Spraguea lophii 42_110]